MGTDWHVFSSYFFTDPTLTKKMDNTYISHVQFKNFCSDIPTTEKFAPTRVLHKDSVGFSFPTNHISRNHLFIFGSSRWGLRPKGVYTSEKSSISRYWSLNIWVCQSIEQEPCIKGIDYWSLCREKFSGGGGGGWKMHVVFLWRSWPMWKIIKPSKEKGVSEIL